MDVLDDCGSLRGRLEDDGVAGQESRNDRINEDKIRILSK